MNTMTLDLKTYAKQVRVTDGVFGTVLQEQGLLAPGRCAEALNSENPVAVGLVAHSYVQAGADVIMTNSLMAHRFGLEPYDLEEQAGELAEAAARIACKAVEGSETKVFGSFGPTGKIVMTCEMESGEIEAAFAETASGLVAGGAQAIVLETFNELTEVYLALKAVRSVCDLPVIVSMAFAYGPDKTATMMGNTPADLSALAATHGAAAVGANCGVGPDVAVKITELLRATTDLPIWIKPNAGLPEFKDGVTSFPMGPDEFASYVQPLIDAGANFIGGCCGCGPEHIRKIRDVVGARGQ